VDSKEAARRHRHFRHVQRFRANHNLAELEADQQREIDKAQKAVPDLQINLTLLLKNIFLIEAIIHGKDTRDYSKTLCSAHMQVQA
jgi:hypothetical protein